jgi:hypothetical protein
MIPPIHGNIQVTSFNMSSEVGDMRDRFILNEHEITRNPSGRWAANPDMFSSH